MNSANNTIWISYSGISDFEKCKRAYYYKHIYRNPKNNNRIQIVSPYLSLGTVVHETIERVAFFSPEKRVNLLQSYEKIWEIYSGKKGGFVSEEQEQEFKQRGREMVLRAEKSPIIKNPVFTFSGLPKFNLFENVELVGSIDWAEIMPSRGIHIIDFKTGKNGEKNDSLQLPIYYILARENFKKKIEKASYWYLNSSEKPVSQDLGDTEAHLKKIKQIALKIKEAIMHNDFSCSSGYKTCFACRDFDAVFSGTAENVGFDEKMKKELYYLVSGQGSIKRMSQGSALKGRQKKIFGLRVKGKTFEDIGRELKISKKEIERESLEIKKALKDNLSNKELKAFIEEIKK